MSLLSLDPARSVLVVVDMQPRFLAAIHEADRLLDRVRFICRVAKLVGVPILATEQYSARMGHTDESLIPMVERTFEKMCFSAADSPEFMLGLRDSGRDQVILVGIETHICMSLTAHGLLRQEYEVAVCPDASSSRTNDRHKLGMERIRDAGIVPAHTDAVAYEWMGRADSPSFKSFLEIVKEAQF